MGSRAERLARPALPTAAESERVGRLVSRYGMRLGARRFVPAENLDEIVVVMRDLNRIGMAAASPGSSMTTRARTPLDVARHEAEYARQIDRLAAEQLDANVGLKLTHLGIHVDPDLMFESARRLLTAPRPAACACASTWRRATSSPRRSALYRRLREAGADNIGIVLQSYLRRSEHDLADMLPLGLNVRIVKKGA